MKRLNFLFIIILLAILACSHGTNNTGEVEEIQRKIPPEAIHPLASEDDLDRLIEDIGDSRIVLLGESSHGTSEFYTWRAAISKKLIQEKKFNIIAVEGDWADAYPANLYIKNHTSSSAREVLNNFDRWPQWMWKNQEIADFLQWLKADNSTKTDPEKTGFYGLDVYGIWESLETLSQTLKRVNPAAATRVMEVMDCFRTFNFDEQQYARATLNNQSCKNEVEALLSAVEQYIAGDSRSEEKLNLLQNTLVVVNAENYYRTAVRNSSLSWNIRDRHMSVSLNNLLEHHGRDSKILVWEHNTHIGDARATDMAEVNMVNVGQLEREKHGDENVYIIGFGTNSGKVLAASSWGSEVKVMNIPPGRKNSWEWILHQQAPLDKIIFMESLKNMEYFKKPTGHRAIGVVYNPKAEAGNYVPSVLPQRYDAFIHIDKTNPLKLLP